MNYLRDWQHQVNASLWRSLTKETMQWKACILWVNSMLNNFLAVNFVCELGPKLLKNTDVNYLLSEVFSQHSLERYFSCHLLGSDP